VINSTEQSPSWESSISSGSQETFCIYGTWRFIIVHEISSFEWIEFNPHIFFTKRAAQPLPKRWVLVGKLENWMKIWVLK